MDQRLSTPYPFLQGKSLRKDLARIESDPIAIMDLPEQFVSQNNVPGKFFFIERRKASGTSGQLRFGLENHFSACCAVIRCARSFCAWSSLVLQVEGHCETYLRHRRRVVHHGRHLFRSNRFRSNLEVTF